MSGKLSSLRKRLSKVEQQMADQLRRAELANCNCKHFPSLTFVMSNRPEEFEAEMNLPCPAHGLRRLGQIHCIRIVASENDPEGVERCRQWDTKLDRLLEIYDARLVEQDSQKLEDDAQEL